MIDRIFVSYKILITHWIIALGLFYFSCTPQPIYQSLKKTDDSNAQTTKKSGWLTPDSAKSNSSPGNPASISTAGAITVPLLAGNLSKEKQDAMMTEIKAWIGTPYRFGLVEKGKGTDCSGFVGFVFKKVHNIDLPRTSDAMYGVGEPVSKKDLKFGDLVFLQNTYKGSKGASHVGVYVGENKLAHASTTVGVTISDLSEEYYSKHYLGCRRILKD